jgi:hypothetical protein
VGVPPQECVGDTAICMALYFSMNPSERTWMLGCCGNHTAVATAHCPGTDSTAHSLPSAVIDKKKSHTEI